MMNNSRFDSYREYIGQFMANWYSRFHDLPQKQLFEAMEYSLLAGGKRLRPVFAFEFCRMCGREWQAAAPFAAAVEMIHTYSLSMTICPAWIMMIFAGADPPTTRSMAKLWPFWPAMRC